MKDHPALILLVAVTVAVAAAGVSRIITGSSDASTPCVSMFRVDLDDPLASDRALSLIQSTYQHEYYHSSISHHHFVRTAPPAMREEISKLVWTESVLEQVRKQFGDHSDPIRAIPDVFDQIYLMRPESDWLDQKKIHYDGNLKLYGTCTIRALTYLSGQDATLVALTSGTNVTTRSHTAIIVDFDRELHYVSLPDEHYRDNDRPPRVIVKSALHILRPGFRPLVLYARILLHRVMVFAARTVRRALESSTNARFGSMLAVDNIMRLLNRMHAGLPVLLIGLPLGAVFLAPLLDPIQFLPYVAYMAMTLANYSSRPIWTSRLARLLLIGVIVYYRSTRNRKKVSTRTRLSFLLLHTTWIGVCYCFEANADMASQFLFAPWQQSIYF